MSHPLAIDIDFDGDELKARRVAAGLGRRKFAARLGTSISQVWKWEAGQWRPSQPYLDKICAVLGCEPGDLACEPDART